MNSLIRIAAVYLGALAVAGCRRDEPRGIEERRVLSGPRPGPRVTADTGARPGEGREQGWEAPRAGLAWELPPGWKEHPPTQPRVGSFVVPSRPGLECSVTLLSGAGGGLAANVNRWRGQLGLTALGAAEFAALPTLSVLGHPARLVEVENDGSGLLGVVCELGAETVFIKMTGPAGALREERENFIAFCRSLSRESGR